jgi:NAD+ kinase
MKLGIVGHLEKPGLEPAVRQFLGHLDERKVDYVVDKRIANRFSDNLLISRTSRFVEEGDCYKGVDMLIAFGGDGTILAAARSVGSLQTPILGINLGKLGFLAELAPQEISGAVDELVSGRYNIEQRLVLEASLAEKQNPPFHAINDVVVAKGRSSRMIELHTRINGSFAVTYRGDGLILSTPTGSTAYALSNGGPIVIPTSKVLGLTPISPHTLSGRPLVVPDDSVVSIAVESADDEVLISTDGQEEACLRAPMEIVIRRAPYFLRLVRRSNQSYFDTLRAKLFWGRDPRSP